MYCKIRYVARLHYDSKCTKKHSLCKKLFEMIKEARGITKQTLTYSSGHKKAALYHIALSPGPLFDYVWNMKILEPMDWYQTYGNKTTIAGNLAFATQWTYSGAMLTNEEHAIFDARLALLVPHLPRGMINYEFYEDLILRDRRQSFILVLKRQFELLIPPISIRSTLDVPGLVALQMLQSYTVQWNAHHQYFGLYLAKSLYYVLPFDILMIISAFSLAPV
jgi:hypothetical protein